MFPDVSLMEIRRAQVSDAKELRRLNILFNGDGVSEEEDVAISLENNPQEIVLVADQGGELIGFCCGQITKSMCYRDLTGEITELFVMDSHRRKGVGGLLMAAMEAECEKQGVCELRLLTGEENHAAQAFYKARGYKPDREVLLTKSVSIE